MALKFLYQFCEPKRWDVIVFKNPLDPSINYIKRLVGKPTETVEIIDGDIYIDGQIARKPPKIQNELWMPIYDNDYHPIEPRLPAFNGHPWSQPFKNETNSNWQTEKDDSTRFVLNDSEDRINWLKYDSSVGNDFKAAYSYDRVQQYRYMPNCSDLMIRFHVEFTDFESTGLIGASLSKYMSDYKASIDMSG